MAAFGSLDERYNQTMINSQSNCVKENRTTWDERLSEVVYNTAVQESTNYTPFQVMYGRVARLPVNINGSADAKKIRYFTRQRRGANYEPESKAEEFNAVDERDEERAIE